MRSVLPSTLVVMLFAAVPAVAQDENPTTPGAIPDPSTYQGSTELQRQSDQQDQQFRQQQAQQPQSYPQSRYNQAYPSPRYAQPQRRPATLSGPRRAATDFGKVPPAGLAAEAANDRGDWVGAIRLWQPLAARGEVNAEYNLGVMYELGHGVPMNKRQAAFWYRKAADQGMAVAMSNLGNGMVRAARGPADLVPAYKWYSLAATHANSAAVRADALHNRSLIIRMMSRSLIAQAEAQARAWHRP